MSYLIPEKPFEIEEVCGYIDKRKEEGKHFSLVVAAEGAHPKDEQGAFTKDGTLDAFGHVKLGGVGEFLAKEIEERTGLRVAPRGAWAPAARRYPDRYRPDTGDALRGEGR